MRESPAPRLNSDGTTDLTFAPGGFGANNSVLALALQSDGKVVIGGRFTTFNSTSVNRVARLNNATLPASQAVTVTATNAAGSGTVSLTLTPALPAAPPTSVTATAGAAQATVSWVAPSSNGGSAVTDYRVEYSTDGLNWTTFTRPASTATSAVVTGLTPGTAYWFQVASVNAAGTGAAAPTSATVTPS